VTGEPIVEEGDRVEAGVGDLESAGATVRSASLPTVTSSVHAWSAVVNVELATMLGLRGAPVGLPGPFDRDLVAQFADAIEREGGTPVSCAVLVDKQGLEDVGGVPVHSLLQVIRVSREEA
jgi:hypothetical protein